MLLNFALVYAIRRVQGNQDDLKLISTHQLFVYPDDVNMLGGTVLTTIIKENIEVLVAAIKGIALELIIDKSTYMAMSWCQITGRSYNRKTENISFERWYISNNLGNTLTNNNSIQTTLICWKKHTYSKGKHRKFSMQNLCLSACYPTIQIYELRNSNFVCCVVWV